MGKIKLPFAVKLILIALLIGILVGLAELFIGHRFILDPLLENVDSEAVHGTFFYPNYYGLVKSIIVAVTFFFVFLCCQKGEIKPAVKSALVGVIALIIFGIYSNLVFPKPQFISTVITAMVHFVFVAGITFIIVKILKFK